MASGSPTDDATNERDVCAACGRRLTQPAVGRRRVHCSHACRQVTYRRRRTGEQRRRLVTLVQADAREFLRSLPAESVDLVVTDPPYFFRRGTTYFREWFADLPDEVWPQILAELYRVLRPDRHAYVFCDRRAHPIFTAAAISAGFRVADTIVWDKQSISLGGGAWHSQYELILFLTKGRRSGNHRNLANIQRARRVVRRYPTEKPVALLQTLIGQSSQPGELVLDPFCGSGNTGRAARELGRRALLCDLDARVAAQRLRLTPVASTGTTA